MGATFIVPFLNRDLIGFAAGRVRVVEFFYGWPDAALVSTAPASAGRWARPTSAMPRPMPAAPT